MTWLWKLRKRRHWIERKGRWAEKAALFYLRLKGYKLVFHRYKTPVGEIDLIVKKGDFIVFVEVKTRKTKVLAYSAVPQKSQKRLRNAALYFIQKNCNKSPHVYRFDVVLIFTHSKPIHLVNAF